MNFTAEEYTDMIICYGIAGENAHAAERLYAERFPNRERHPDRRTITGCIQRSRETGFLLPRHQNRVNVSVRRHVHDDEEVLRAFEENPGNSVRRVASALGISRCTVHRILRENGLHPFHYQRVHQLLARDEAQRVYFCEGIFILLITIFVFICYIFNIPTINKTCRVPRTVSARYFISRSYFVDG